MARTNRNYLDLTGQTYNFLTVLREVETRKGLRFWECRCDCGTITVVQQGAIRSGNTKGCGCRVNAPKHGMSKTPTFSSWVNMKSRCLYEKAPNYAEYGGRGITVCDRWLESFENFLADMGVAPPKHSIERLDVNGNYDPSNCKWATKSEQNNNKRTNHVLTYQGRTQTATQWARELHMSKSVILGRLNRSGWTVEQTLSTPILKPAEKRLVRFRSSSNA